MCTQIRVTVRSVYGKPAIYPACPAAETFARIAGSKTLTQETVRAIKSLGIAVICDADASVRAIFA